MAFINTVAPERATGRVREQYEEDLKRTGRVTTATQAFSLRPEVLDSWRSLIDTIRSNMSPRHYELATVAASSRLRCSL
jgi:hypothetical protein